MKKINKAYRHCYYNKNNFPDLPAIHSCKACSDIRRQEGDWKRAPLVIPEKCHFCKKLIK